jgi:hypothetical protein
MAHLPSSLGVLGFIYQVRGEFDKSEQCLKEALSLSQKSKEVQSIVGIYGNLGWLYLDKGEYAKARECYEKQYDVSEKAGEKYMKMSATTVLLLVYVELGEYEKVENSIDGLYQFAQEVEDNGMLAFLDVARAELFRAQHKWEESIKYFERSIHEMELMNARQWDLYKFVKFLFEYARMYMERDQRGDREKALNLLNQALEIFQKLGAKKDIEKTKKLLDVLHPVPTQVGGETVSPESIESTDMRSSIIVTPKELKIGENVELEIELTNTNKTGAILLTRIAGIIPEGFTAAKKPELYRLEDTGVNMKEKRIDPLKTEEVRLTLTPEIRGTFQIKPKIIYTDENGKEKTHMPKPINITVKELGIKGWLKGEK